MLLFTFLGFKVASAPHDANHDLDGCSHTDATAPQQMMISVELVLRIEVVLAPHGSVQVLKLL